MTLHDQLLNLYSAIEGMPESEEKKEMERMAEQSVEMAKGMEEQMEAMSDALHLLTKG